MACSLKALGLSWLLSGIVFICVVKGPNTMSAWAIWGGAVMLGWIVVGLPLTALGDKIFRIPYVLLARIGGLGGGLLMLSPNLFVRLFSRPAHFAPFAVRNLALPSTAFAIAAATGRLYRCFLTRHSRSVDCPGGAWADRCRRYLISNPLLNC